ncbi:hypothetical protein CDAR_78361 [Caerostris darwini]|uniref:Uncharacterized protein n=1 Tax=Caerostris darwini TaxID=1538125 RepID=A0AAV4SET6_9ARAC|nr:hypothetical protein CDAR_78361 [Caerostris darwini]
MAFGDDGVRKGASLKRLQKEHPCEEHRREVKRKRIRLTLVESLQTSCEHFRKYFVMPLNLDVTPSSLVFTCDIQLEVKVFLVPNQCRYYHLF